ncbi:TonB-dependent receptor, beta-barrel [sediment metagenome]|uniref:TonB-dependent receptor, beta-barrel n=1 Tax=sediment metagenome TaxID=749907 RepID=D9PFU1_9ZZZZ
MNASRKEGEDLDYPKARYYQESLRDLEGMNFFDTVGNGVDRTVGLRGFSEGNSVITLVDGVRVNEVDGDDVYYPLLPMDDLESIQVDRGSASPIYGSNAFAGVVHLTTGAYREAPMTFFGGWEMSSFDGMRFHQGVSGTLADKLTPVGGKFKYYFNGSRDNNDGFRDNGDYRITNFNIKSEYELPDAGGRIYAGVKHTDDDISNPGALTFDQYQRDLEPTLKNLDGRHMDVTTVQLGMDKTFWDERILASLMASSRTNDLSFYTTTISFADFPDGFDPDTDLVTTKSRSTDLIWQLAYQDEWDWLSNQSVMGMEIRDASNQSLEQDAFLGNVVRSTAAETDRLAEPENAGLYWRETLNASDKLIGHFGMRHDYHWLDVRDQVTPTDSLSRRWRESSLSGGITVKPVESVDLFTNYSQGFRVPTISELAPFSGTVSTNLTPERSDSYEIGGRVRHGILPR